MDALVAIGTGAAYLYSLIVVIMAFAGQSLTQGGMRLDAYFDVAAVVITLVIAGK
jgi:cation transport ATPase